MKNQLGERFILNSVNEALPASPKVSPNGAGKRLDAFSLGLLWSRPLQILPRLVLLNPDMGVRVDERRQLKNNTLKARPYFLQMLILVVFTKCQAKQSCKRQVVVV